LSTRLIDNSRFVRHPMPIIDFQPLARALKRSQNPKGRFLSPSPSVFICVHPWSK
jgi:hypothetical protein